LQLYAGLQSWWPRYRDGGLPSNDFGGQEPGAAKEINATAHGEYHVTFRFTEKLAVKGKGRPSIRPMGRRGSRWTRRAGISINI
jgi:glutathione peroxidase-family protein